MDGESKEKVNDEGGGWKEKVKRRRRGIKKRGPDGWMD